MARFYGLLGRAWFRFVSYRIIAQIVLVGILLGTVTGGAAIVLSIARSGNISSVLTRYGELLFGNQASFETVVHAAFAATVVFILAVWQAVFFVKILTRPHKYRFSRSAAFYPKNPNYTNALEQDEYIVFRILNDGLADLFNVRITVTLRNFNPTNQTFQHYFCRILNDHVPVFRRGMPFRIYIHTGMIEVKSNSSAGAIDRRFLSPFETAAAPKNVELISVNTAAATLAFLDLPNDAISFIVYVEGHDIDMNQTKSATYVYPLVEMKHGYFASIAPRTAKESRYRGDERFRFFTQKEIDQKFDVVVPLVSDS